jgi:hypothetical protein
VVAAVLAAALFVGVGLAIGMVPVELREQVRQWTAARRGSANGL